MSNREQICSLYSNSIHSNFGQANLTTQNQANYNGEKQKRLSREEMKILMIERQFENQAKMELKKSKSGRKKDDGSNKSMGSDNSVKYLQGNESTLATEKSKVSGSPESEDTQIKLGSNLNTQEPSELPVKKVKLETSNGGNRFEINSQYILDYQKKCQEKKIPNESEISFKKSELSSILKDDQNTNKLIDSQRELGKALENWEVKSVLSLREFRDYFCN